LYVPVLIPLYIVHRRAKKKKGGGKEKEKRKKGKEKSLQPLATNNKSSLFLN
jgi:hypothetical protein